jgi:hypothetical protein
MRGTAEMKRKPDQMTEEELLQACSLRPWEKRLSSSGCFLSSVLSVLLLVFFPLPFQLPWFVYLILWLVVVLAFMNLLRFIVGWRFRPHRRELERRYGHIPFSRIVEETRQALQASGAPEWVVLFRGTTRNGVVLAFLRIEWYDRPGKPGRIVVTISPKFEFENSVDPRPKMEAKERELTPAEEARLRSALEALPSLMLTDTMDTNATRGYPCTVAVLRRQPSMVTQATCNLMGLSEAEMDSPTPTLMRHLLALAESLSKHPLIAGWSTFRRSMGKEELSFSLEEAHHLMKQPEAPDWLLLLEGAALPHGGARHIRLSLRETPAAVGHLSVITRSFVSPMEDPLAQIEFTEADLTQDVCEPILDHLKSLQPGSPLRLPDSVKDGFPCSITVLRKSPFVVMEAECNLSGVSEEERQLPLIHLMAWMCELSLIMGSSPLMVGSCDKYGNIRIGPH